MLRNALGSLVFFFTVFFALSLASLDAHADALPDGVRGVAYNVSYENLDAYPQYVFFIYPTTNSGFAYRVETGKSITNLMSRIGQHGSPGSSLYAVKKSEFDKPEYKKNRYEHGDKNELVQVFAPIPGAVKSNLIVSPPGGYVAFDSPQKELTRVFRIVKVTDDTLELAVAKNEMLLRDGTKKPVPFGQELDDSAKRASVWPFGRDSGPAAASAAPASSAATPVEPPKKRGCAVGDRGVRGEPAIGWIAAFAGAAVVRRRRRR